MQTEEIYLKGQQIKKKRRTNCDSWRHHRDITMKNKNKLN